MRPVVPFHVGGASYWPSGDRMTDDEARADKAWVLSYNNRVRRAALVAEAAGHGAASPRPADSAGMSAVATAIGHDHALELVAYEGDPMAIVKVYHWRPDGTECPVPHTCALEGGTWARAFGNSIRAWSVVSRDPLTLAPSILCPDPRCRDHGFIEQGKWRPA